MSSIPVKNKIIPQLISYLFHPVWYPLAGIVFLLKLNIGDTSVPLKYQLLIIKITFLCTIVLPLAMLPLMYYLKAIKNFYLHTKRERFIPLTLMCVAYYFEYFLIYYYAPTYLVVVFLFSVCLAMLFVLIVNIFRKISIHMVGLGGFTGLLLALCIVYHIDLLYILAGCILLSGIIASARLILNMHTIHEIWTGYLMGFFIVFLSFLIY